MERPSDMILAKIHLYNQIITIIGTLKFYNLLNYTFMKFNTTAGTIHFSVKLRRVQFILTFVTCNLL